MDNRVSGVDVGVGDNVVNPVKITSFDDSVNSTQKDNIDKCTLYDPVYNPSHYTSGGVECIEAIRASMDFDDYCGYLKGNVMKYLWRYKKKNDPLQDLEKARWYLDRLIEDYRRESIQKEQIKNTIIDRYDP